MKGDWSRIEPAVFFSSAAVVVFVLAFGVSDPDGAKDTFLGLQNWIVGTFGWLFVASTAFFLVFSAWCAFGARGRLRLGPEGEAPDFALHSWFAMLFSAGMGIGIMFFGVAEPVTHYASVRLRPLPEARSPHNRR